MPKRIPVDGVVGVTRNGKTVYAKVGEVFDFTPEEIADIAKIEKANNLKLLRKPVNETAPVDGEDGSAAAAAAANNAGGKVTTTKTVAELKALAEANSVDLGDATKKDDIIAKLVAADVVIDAPAADEDEL